MTDRHDTTRKGEHTVHVVASANLVRTSCSRTLYMSTIDLCRPYVGITSIVRYFYGINYTEQLLRKCTLR